MIGAVGETALAGLRYQQVGPKDGGFIAGCCSRVWRDLRLKHVSSKKYNSLYSIFRGRRELAFVGPFSSIALISWHAANRQLVAPQMRGLVSLFAFVLKGVAILQCSDTSSVLEVGQCSIFLPSAEISVEVEGASSLVLMYLCDHPQPLSQALKRRVSQFQDSLTTTRAEHRHEKQVGFMRVKRKPLVEQTTSVEQSECEARASQETEQGQSVDGNESQAVSLGEHTDVQFSVIWPWHDRQQVVHRFIVGCASLTPSRLSRWSASIKSWREPWLQVI